MPSALASARARRRRRRDRRGHGPGRGRHGHRARHHARSRSAPVLDAAAALGGRPVAVRAGVERRRPPRHRGVSHHSATRARPRRGPGGRTGARRACSAALAPGRRGTRRGRGRRRRRRPLARGPACASPRWVAAPRRTRCSSGRGGGRSGGAAGLTPRPARHRRNDVAAPKLERLMNLTAALLDTRVPLTAEALRSGSSGLPRRPRRSFRAAVRARQGRPARDGHPDPRRGVPRRPTAPAEGYRIIRTTSTTCATRASPPTSWPRCTSPPAAVRIDGVPGARRPLEARRHARRTDGRVARLARRVERAVGRSQRW